MTVKELITKLRQYDPNLKVVFGVGISECETAEFEVVDDALVIEPEEPWNGGSGDIT